MPLVSHRRIANFPKSFAELLCADEGEFDRLIDAMNMDCGGLRAKGKKKQHVVAGWTGCYAMTWGLQGWIADADEKDEEGMEGMEKGRC